MARILADYHQAPFTLDNLAFDAYLLDAGSNFHFLYPFGPI